ncbi:MAG: hypothetical protein H7A26_03770 [Spirochaetales bacterium]|nr:hypothetical protein [Spirochaetales bacterium]
MKIRILFLLLIVIPPLQNVFSQSPKPRVAVSVPVNNMGDEQYDTLCTVIQDTILLSLKIIDKYDAIPIPLEDRRSPSVIAAEDNIDTIIFGETSVEQGYACVMKLSVFDKAKNMTVLDKEETAETVLDIFDASDSITASLLEAFSGVHIAYGTLSVDFEDTGVYQILLNGEPIGSSFTSLPKILIGKYKVEVLQAGALEYIQVFEDMVEIRENRTTRITIAAPPISDFEVEQFSDIDRFVLENWYKSDYRGRIETRLSEAELSASGRSGKDYRILKTKYSIFTRLFENRISPEKAFSENKPAFDRKTYDSLLNGNLRETPPEGYAFPPGTAAVLSEKQRILEKQMMESGKIPLVRPGDIIIDGKCGDWTAIPVLAEDETGDSVSGTAGDISLVQMAMDDQYLYMHIGTGLDQPRNTEGLWYQVFITVPGGNMNFICGVRNGSWHAISSKWESETRTSTQLFSGIMKKGDNFIECRYLLSDIYKYLEKDKKYFAMAQSGINSGRQQDIAYFKSDDQSVSFISF